MENSYDRKPPQQS